jgi:hypothetical protein
MAIPLPPGDATWTPFLDTIRILSIRRRWYSPRPVSQNPAAHRSFPGCANSYCVAGSEAG